MQTAPALIFDVDGTLAETERDGHLPAFNAAFAEFGLPWVWDARLYGELLEVTGGKERIRHFAGRYDPRRAAAADFGELVQQLHRAKTAHYVRRVAAGAIPLRPGVAELIGAARAAGLRLAIATTTAPENVHALLRASLAPDAAGWFEVVGAGDVVPAKKPAPDIYNWVRERLGLPAAACLAIEDSANGLDAARAAGLRCLVCRGEYSRDQDFSAAWRVVDSLEGIAPKDLFPPAP